MYLIILPIIALFLGADDKVSDMENRIAEYQAEIDEITPELNEMNRMIEIKQKTQTLGFQDSDVSFSNNMIRNHLFKDSWFYKVFWTEKFIDVMKIKNNLSIYEILSNNNFSTTNFFYIALSANDEYQIKRPINLELHRPRYALVYNNIIEDSIVDNDYYKVLKTIYFEDSDSKWKTITYKNDEYKNVHEKTLYT